jgi:hypothetical protein
MNKFLKISVGIILLTPLVLFGQNNVVFQCIKLFESGYETIPQSERVYSTHFAKEDTRYVDYEIEFKNNLYNVRDNTVTVKAFFYKPDGSLFGDPTDDYSIPSNWETAYIWKGWGWKDEGNWEIGTYRLVIYLDNKKATETLFSVYDKYWTR